MYSFGNFQRAELGPHRLPKLSDGFEGVLQIAKTWIKDGRKGPLFMCECVVAQSNMQAHPVGQRIMWMQDLTNKNVCDNALFQWAAAVYGFQENNEPALNWLRQNLGNDPQTGRTGLFHYATYVNQEFNPFTHNMETQQPRYVAVRVYQTTTQNNRTFRAHNFAPVQTAS